MGLLLQYYVFGHGVKLPVNAELESIIVPVLIYENKILKANTDNRMEIFVGTGSINLIGRKTK